MLVCRSDSCMFLERIAWHKITHCIFWTTCPEFLNPIIYLSGCIWARQYHTAPFNQIIKKAIKEREAGFLSGFLMLELSSSTLHSYLFTLTLCLDLLHRIHSPVIDRRCWIVMRHAVSGIVIAFGTCTIRCAWIIETCSVRAACH